MLAQDEKSTPFSEPLSRPMGINLFHANEIKKKSLNILFFISPDCGLTNRYAETLRKLQVEFGSKTFAWYLVIPERKHKRSDIVRYLNKHRLERYAIMLDPEMILTKQWAVKHYPECLLLNSKGEVLYQGPIDDRITDLSRWSKSAEREYLKEAILAVLFQKNNTTTW